MEGEVDVLGADVETARAQRGEDGGDMSHVLVEATNGGDRHVVDICASILIVRLKDQVHEMLLGVLCAVETKGHAAKLEASPSPTEGGLGAVFTCNERLHVGRLHVNDGDEVSAGHPLDVLVDARQGIG